MKIIFFGTPEIAATALSAILEEPAYSVSAVVTQPDRPAGRGGRLSQPPVKDLALKHNIPVLQPASVKADISTTIQNLSQYGPFELGVVVAFGQILPVEVLTLPRAGCVNVHTSLLPRWRGAAPIQRAIMDGDSLSGVSIMKMELGLDTGPVYLSESTTISPQDTAGTLHDRLAAMGARLLRKNLSAIASGALKPQAQSEVGVTYAKKISNDECKIDWSYTADENWRKIRALNPAPGAYTRLDGKRVKIWSAEPFEPGSSVAAVLPGSLALSKDGRLLVRCADQWLAILELQLEGKKKMDTTEFLRGLKTQAPAFD